MIYNQVFNYLYYNKRDLAEELKKEIWGFEEIIDTYNGESLQLILLHFIMDYDTDILAVCLHGVDEALKCKVFSCLSLRSRRDVLFELESDPLLPVKYVQSMQGRFCDTAMNLNAEGKILAIFEEIVS